MLQLHQQVKAYKFRVWQTTRVRCIATVQSFFVAQNQLFLNEYKKIISHTLKCPKMALL